MEIETKKLLGYTLEIISIEAYKEYYKSCKTFSDYSEKAFLKSIGIPAVYFKDQPMDTQKILLDNQEDIIKRKYNNQYILILKKDMDVLNCVRVKNYDEMDLAFERITPELPNLILIKEHIKDGYVTMFKPYNTETLGKGVYNPGVFIDYPVLLKKAPEVHTGFYYVPNDNEEFDRCVYEYDQVIDYSEYQNLEILVNKLLNEDKNCIKNDLINKELLREPDELLVQLFKDKFIPKGFIKKVSRYIYKNDLQFINVFSFVELLLNYDDNITGYKATKNLRRSIQAIQEYTKTTKGTKNGN